MIIWLWYKDPSLLTLVSAKALPSASLYLHVASGNIDLYTPFSGGYLCGAQHSKFFFAVKIVHWLLTKALYSATAGETPQFVKNSFSDAVDQSYPAATSVVSEIIIREWQA